MVSKNYNLNLRNIRATMMTNAVLRALDDCLPNSTRRLAYDALMDLFCQQGVDVVTDEIRAEAGLPPRGDDGYTLDELAAMEAARLEMLLRPVTTRLDITVVANDKSPR